MCVRDRLQYRVGTREAAGPKRIKRRVHIAEKHVFASPAGVAKCITVCRFCRGKECGASAIAMPAVLMM